MSTTARYRAGRVGWLGLAALTGCVSLRAPVPMASRSDLFEPGPARCLVVFLPGRGDAADTFFDEGFVTAVRRSGLSIDLVAADAELGYYANASFITRLDEDVLTPARRRGYARSWIVGASMGGFGSLFYASQHPEQVDGVLALAPWLGDAGATDPIRAAGGLARWQPPPPARFDAGNYQAQLWRWLREVTVEGRPGPSIWLGWGSHDRLGRSDELLAAALPGDRVLHAPGGHQWATWRELLGEFLERSELAADCGR
jgi:pimeloyl-ACP methyl ester carboxylesterase